MDRRQFLVTSAGSIGAVFTSDLWSVARAQTAEPGRSPYGPLGPADENGIRLPEGFTSRVVARAGEAVGDTGYTWPVFPDGAATFDDGDGGWYHTVNSEALTPGDGGVSALRYDADGTVVDAYALLTGTWRNCAGGPTPWGTWLSCEEWENLDADDGDPPAGQVWECDPTAEGSGEVRPALGAFIHEAVAVDPDGEALYMTEDHAEGGFYRFVPDAYPDLSSGTLEVATVDDGAVTWTEVPDPSAESGPTRGQVQAMTAFAGGEGCWYDRGQVFFTTKDDDRVWQLDTEAQTLELLYDADALERPPLRGVDNVTVEAGSGDVLVAEDGDDMEIVLITAEGVVAPLLQIAEEPLPDESAPSEVTGPAFSPDGTRLYFSSQRGGDPQEGITYEVTGPFRGAGRSTDASTATTIAGLGDATPETDEQAPGDGDDDGVPAAVPIGIGVAAVAAVATGVTLVRRRRGGDDEGEAGQSG